MKKGYRETDLVDSVQPPTLKGPVGSSDRNLRATLLGHSEELLARAPPVDSL
jgi:hypothetical protein